MNGTLDPRGWALWMITFLYFTGSVFYVKLKLRVQPPRAQPALMGKIQAGLPSLGYGALVLTYLLVVTLLRGYSWLFLVAFAPYFLKVLWGVFNWQSKDNLNVTRFGFIEVAHSIIFCLISIAAFFDSASVS